MFQRILVPLDGSTRAEQAVPVAARIGRASGGSVVLLRVADLSPTSRPHLPGSCESGPPMPPPPAWTPDAVAVSQRHAADYLEGVARTDGLPDCAPETEVPASPSVAAAILTTAQAQHADLIVLCSHGHSGHLRWPLGSIAEKVVHHAAVPVLLLREPSRSATLVHPGLRGPLRLLVPLDGSELAESVLVPAASTLAALAAPGPAAMHLVRVLESRDVMLAPGPWSRDESVTKDARDWALREGKAYLSAVADRLHHGVTAELPLVVTWSAIFDDHPGSYPPDVAAALLRTADVGEATEGAAPAGRCDLIAMTTHGQGGLRQWTMGSIAERVLSATPLPMLIVRPHESATEEEWTRQPTTNSQQER